MNSTLYRPGRYHHPTQAARAGTPVPLPVSVFVDHEKVYFRHDDANGSKQILVASLGPGSPRSNLAFKITVCRYNAEDLAIIALNISTYVYRSFTFLAIRY